MDVHRRPPDDVCMQSLVAYVRVSSEAQFDGYGLDIQRSDIAKWAERNGFEIATTCDDIGVSGAREASERPGLTEALALLRDGRADGLIVARLDRLARQLTVQEAVLARVWRDSRRVFSSDSGEILQDDPSDPMRTAMRQMAGVFAQLDRAMIIKRLRDGRRAKQAAGLYSGGGFAFGYGPKSERELNVLKHARALEAAGRSWSQIAQTLNRLGSEYKPRTAAQWEPNNAYNQLRIARGDPALRGIANLQKPMRTRADRAVKRPQPGLSAMQVKLALHISGASLNRLIVAGRLTPAPFGVRQRLRFPLHEVIELQAEYETYAGPDWTDAATVARLFGVHPRTIHRRGLKGTLPMIILPGGFHRFPVAEVYLIAGMDLPHETDPSSGRRTYV
jgi:DNA invertase Pin-like site-specific DNA recombinase